MKLTVNLCAIILSFMTALIIISVFFRYALNNSIMWSAELTRYLMVFLSMFGAALALRNDEHIGLSILYDKLSIQCQRLIDIFRYTLLFLFSCLLAYEGFKFAVTTEATGEILPISMKYPHSIMFFAALLMMLILLSKIQKLLFYKK